ncbi:MAG: hypothetical protein ACFFDK_08755 [Promethearchaeota archaeon]
MIIKFLFKSQSKSKDVAEAIEVAKKRDGKINGEMYQVEFSSTQDKDLMKLYILVGHLEGTSLIINSEEFKPNVIYCIFNCPRNTICYGKCIYTDEHQKLAAMKFCEKFKSFRSNGDFDFYIHI